MKSIISFVLNHKRSSVLIIAISVISCVVFAFFFSNAPKDEAELSSEAVSDEISASEQSSFDEAESSNVSIDDHASEDENASEDETQNVIYGENGIKILVENIEFEASKEPQVEFLFENNSETDYLFNIQDISVNGYMVSSSMNGDGVAVKAKKGTQQRFFVSIYGSSLEKCGIELIADIEISFWICDEGNKETFFTPMLKIKTPIYDTYSPTVNHSGYIAYNDNDVKIVVKGFKDFDSSKIKGIEVYVENNSKKTVMIRAKVISINGYDIDPLFYTAPLYYTEYPMVTENILPSKKSVGGLSFRSEDLEAHNITKINSMEHYFYIEDWETASDIDKTDIIELERDYFSVPSKNPDEPSIMHWATEIDFTKEEFFAWLEGNCNKSIQNEHGETVNIHEESGAEHARSLIKGKKVYWLTINGIPLKPDDTICVSYFDDKSVMIWYPSKSTGKPTYCYFRYYDESYTETLKKGITELFQIKNTDIPNSWNIKKFSLLKYPLYDHKEDKYVDTDVLVKNLDNRDRYFVIDYCEVTFFDAENLYKEDDFKHMGFMDAVNNY